MVAKSNKGENELRLRYIKFWYEMNKINRSRDYRLCDLVVIKLA